jgi:hypothetical protein
MRTRIVSETIWDRGKLQYNIGAQFEIVCDPVPFDIAEAHVELGNAIVAISEHDNSVYQVFDHDIGPTFEGLWKGCTFHLLVKRL